MTPDKEKLLETMMEIEQHKFIIECISGWKYSDPHKKKAMFKIRQCKLDRAEAKLNRLLETSSEAKEAYERALQILKSLDPIMKELENAPKRV